MKKKLKYKSPVLKEPNAVELLRWIFAIKRRKKKTKDDYLLINSLVDKFNKERVNK